MIGNRDDKRPRESHSLGLFIPFRQGGLNPRLVALIVSI